MVNENKKIMLNLFNKFNKDDFQTPEQFKALIGFNDLSELERTLVGEYIHGRMEVRNRGKERGVARVNQVTAPWDK